jgi:hypothetical protein
VLRVALIKQIGAVAAIRSNRIVISIQP